MKFSEHWLREFINPSISTEKLCEQLNDAGLEVEGSEPIYKKFSGVVIAEIFKVEPHPNADRLRICQVWIGKAKHITIVTNVTIVQTGMKIATALVGAHLPELEIKSANLRGVESFGMFCSKKSLGINENDTNLLRFPSDAPVGQDVRDYLKLNDLSIEVKLTPNRGDCLSIIGIAREVGVANNLLFKAPKIKPISATVQDKIKIQVKAPKACPHYLSRVIRFINSKAETPLWMQEKLRRSGLCSIHPVVDVTNYVMLELGQPMHAFDLDKLAGTIIIRYAEEKENFISLDNQQLKLDSNVLVITNEEKVLAMAGIIGGKDSSVSSNTQDIVLESAFFTPIEIMGKARKYGLHTESSLRFERGVDPQLQLFAMERATELLLSIVGGKAGSVIEKTSEKYLPQRHPILLRQARIKRLLGCEIVPQKIQQILEHLSMNVKKVKQGWKVTPPSFRFDIEIEADLIEEIARVYGYNNIPVNLPILPIHMLPALTTQLPINELRQRLKNRGYQEVLSYSFVDADLQKLIAPQEESLAVTNPIASHLSVMRTTLFSSMLPIMIYNQKRQQERGRIFEIGLRFIQRNDQLEQIPTLAGLSWGTLLQEQWGTKGKNIDFYDIKGEVEALIIGKRVTFSPTQHPAFHPGKSAELHFNGKIIGYVGLLHPELEQKLEVSGTYGFELNLSTLLETHLPSYKPISKFPLIRRDLALVVDKEITADKIYSSIAEVSTKLLNEIIIFDLYEGENIPSGKKSMAIGLVLQAVDHTLVEEEINKTLTFIVDFLQKRYQITLRN